MSKQKFRGFVFTINNYTDEDIVEVMVIAEQCVYLIAGFEEGEQGTPHIQGYMYFKNPRYLTKMFTRAWVEAAKGSPLENYTYCSKEGDFWEHGEIPCQGRLAKERLEEVMNNPYENFRLYNQYRKCYKELQRSIPKTHTRRLFLLDYKDRYDIAKECESVLFIPDEKFDIYDEQQVVILDYSASLYRHVVDWVNGFPMTIKRGYELLKFDPEIIYIMYSNHNEYALLKKLYHKLIYN